LLSLFDVHVQKAPVSGRIVYLKHTLGKFLSTTKTDCGDYNENVLMGIECSEYAGKKVGVRMIAGLMVRRIVTWVDLGEQLKRSERISMIQYGSRCDLYIPLTVKVLVKLGAKVRGGETIVATFE
jgi:phosphatidylserine decarboxylase